MDETSTARRNLRLLSGLGLFAIAMAYLEAVVVVYLRYAYYPDDPLTIFPARILSQIHLAIELGREAATVVMLAAVAVLAVRGAMRRFAAFVYLFGLWDIFYYVWLKVTLGWPVSWTEWDILFLIPWAWLGPWLTPVAIALLFVVWGARVLASDREPRFGKLALTLFLSGTALCLAAFLEPALPLLPHGPAAFADFVPQRFLWGLYVPGVVMMGAGLFVSSKGGRGVWLNADTGVHVRIVEEGEK